MTEAVRPEGRHRAGAVPRAALYARVSTSEQTPENQLAALRRYAAARGLEATEYVDHGVSGVKEKRPQLDAMLAGARRREVDIVIVTKLDRLARSLHHLVALGREFEAVGVEFERDLIRVIAGLLRASHRVRTGCAHSPGEPSDLHVSVYPIARDGLRPMRGDSALAFNLSGPAQASLALRPVRSLTRPRRISVSRVATKAYRHLLGPDFHRLR